MKINLKDGITTKQYHVDKCIELQNDNQSSETLATHFTEDLIVTVDNSNSLQLIAKVERKNVKKDGKRNPPNPIDLYFIKSQEIFNKLDLKLTTSGEIVSVSNRDEALKNWEYIKIFLDRYFVSDDERVISTLKGWTTQIDAVVKNEKSFLQSVKNDLLYNRFFYGYWMNFGSGQSTKNQNFPGMFGRSTTILTEEIKALEVDGVKQVEIVGSLNKDESDMAAIAMSLGIEETQMEGLTVELNGLCLFDDNGLIEKMDMKTEVKMRESDFLRRFSLTVKNKQAL